MDSLSDLMHAFGVSHCGVDIVAALPIEIAELILRKLDPRSLLNVARVSRKWLNLCKSSYRLRKNVRQHLRKQKRRMIQNDLALSKMSKKQILSKTSRMQDDLAQRTSRQDFVITPVFGMTGIVKSSIPKSRSHDKKPISRASILSTRSSLKFR